MFDVFKKKSNTSSEIFFQEHRYFLAKNLLTPELLEHIQISWNAFEKHPFDQVFVESEGIHREDSSWTKPFTTVEFGAAPFGVYLLAHLQKSIEEMLNLELVPTYNYSRKYNRNAVLYAHRDRPSCEVSATICIDQDTDNNEPWPIWLLNNKNYAGYKYESFFGLSQKKSTHERSSIGCKAISMNPGDVLIYQGINVLHWRDPLEGNFSKNIFIHYVDKNGPLYKENPCLKFDGRESIYGTYEVDFINYQPMLDLNLRSEDEPEWLSKLASAGITPVD
ncbi:MAG: hypothetical protein CMD55_03850 [Gammaproteobacteria bacterium]|nr:hypothetical protein [Gammaproteobacteria bacterium]